MEKVIHEINITLASLGMTEANAPTDDYLVWLYTQALIEHRSIPELPLDWIAYRLIAKQALPAEIEWWKERSQSVMGRAA